MVGADDVYLGHRVRCGGVDAQDGGVMRAYTLTDKDGSIVSFGACAEPDE